MLPKIKSGTTLKIIIAILMLLLGVIGMNAQTFTVKGVVEDENG